MSRTKWRTREQRIQHVRSVWRREWRFLGQWLKQSGGLAGLLAGHRRYPRAAQYLRALRLIENNPSRPARGDR
jgi:hypothetical protein